MVKRVDLQGEKMTRRISLKIESDNREKFNTGLEEVGLSVIRETPDPVTDTVQR